MTYIIIHFENYIFCVTISVNSNNLYLNFSPEIRMKWCLKRTFVKKIYFKRIPKTEGYRLGTIFVEHHYMMFKIKYCTFERVGWSHTIRCSFEEMNCYHNILSMHHIWTPSTWFRKKVEFGETMAFAKMWHGLYC